MHRTRMKYIQALYIRMLVGLKCRKPAVTEPNQNTPGITELSNDADDALFQRVLYRPNLVLQYLLQDRESNKYCLRYRSHTKELD